MYSDRLASGSHPNRPLPSTEVFITAQDVLLEHAPAIVRATQEGIEDVVALMATPMRVHMIGSAWAPDPYGSVQWFVERNQITRQDRAGERQLFWDTLRNDLEADPVRTDTPHIGYMLVAQDMTARQSSDRVLNFVFGVTSKEIGQSVQSVWRFMEAGLNMERVVLAARHIARHEFGHIVGLDQETIARQDHRGGIAEGHCVNDCTMQQVMSVPEVLDLAMRLQQSHNAGFCEDCAGFLALR